MNIKDIKNIKINNSDIKKYYTKMKLYGSKSKIMY